MSDDGKCHFITPYTQKDVWGSTTQCARMCWRPATHGARCEEHANQKQLTMDEAFGPQPKRDSRRSVTFTSRW